MESEPLSASVEWEARRVVAAFGLERCSNGQVDFSGDSASFIGFREKIPVYWYLNIGSASLTFIEIGDSDGVVPGVACRVWLVSDNRWWFISHEQYNELMVHGLYRLGFDYESVLYQLPPLSAHEKLELRLSMPREFWPQKWLDEEGV